MAEAGPCYSIRVALRLAECDGCFASLQHGVRAVFLDPGAARLCVSDAWVSVACVCLRACGVPCLAAAERLAQDGGDGIAPQTMPCPDALQRLTAVLLVEDADSDELRGFDQPWYGLINHGMV